MISITDYINMKGKKFREKLASGYTMCSCDSLRFNEGNLPDYRYYIVQDLYAMRYDLAYAHEYKRMYTRLLQRMSPGSELEVTSLGCGNMVDYWSLKRVLPANCRVSYHGVDVIDWDDKFAGCKGDKIDFSLQYISDYLYDCDELESDVYVFPKSISEIDDDELEAICRIISEKGFAKDEVHFLFSMRANQYSLERDMAKTDKICAAIRAAGMMPDGKSGSLYTGPDKMIYNCDSDFNIDRLKKSYDMLNNLPYMCDNYHSGCCSCDLCAENRNQPMLKTKYIRYQIFTFRKVA